MTRSADPLDEGTSADGAWLELSVAADHEAVEAVSEILSRAAPGGTTVEPAFRLVDEGLAAEIDLDRPAIVRAYLPARDRTATEAAVESARAALGHLRAFGLRPIGELETRIVHESDWAEAWKAHFPVIRVGRRIVIRPTWRRHRRGSDDVVLALDPGMAFGTGLHPTTRLCLAAIERLADDGRLSTPNAARVLDVGCGSGILAIAALKLGATSAIGVDNDPQALTASQDNAERNGVAERLALFLPEDHASEPADVFVANILAGPLGELAPTFAAAAKPGAPFAISGILDGQQHELLARYAEWFDALRVDTRDGWVRISGRRRG